jgi:hypothetical protein
MRARTSYVAAMAEPDDPLSSLDALPDAAQGVTEAVAGDAAADRVKLRGEGQKLAPDVAGGGHRQRQ